MHVERARRPVTLDQVLAVEHINGETATNVDNVLQEMFILATAKRVVGVFLDATVIDRYFCIKTKLSDLC